MAPGAMTPLSGPPCCLRVSMIRTWCSPAGAPSSGLLVVRRKLPSALTMPRALVCFSGRSKTTWLPSSSRAAEPSLQTTLPSTGKGPLPPQPLKHSIIPVVKITILGLERANPIMLGFLDDEDEIQSVAVVNDLAVVTDGQPAQVGAIDVVANRPDAAVAKDELADAGMVAAELPGPDAIDDPGAGNQVVAGLGQGILDAGDPAGKAGPGPAIDRPIPHLEPAEHADRHMLFPCQKRITGAIRDTCQPGVAGEGGHHLAGRNGEIPQNDCAVAIDIEPILAVGVVGSAPHVADAGGVVSQGSRRIIRGTEPVLQCLCRARVGRRGGVVDIEILRHAEPGRAPPARAIIRLHLGLPGGHGLLAVFAGEVPLALKGSLFHVRHDENKVGGPAIGVGNAERRKGI